MVHSSQEEIQLCNHVWKLSCHLAQQPLAQCHDALANIQVLGRCILHSQGNGMMHKDLVGLRHILQDQAPGRTLGHREPASAWHPEGQRTPEIHFCNYALG